MTKPPKIHEVTCPSLISSDPLDLTDCDCRAQYDVGGRKLTTEELRAWQERACLPPIHFAAFGAELTRCGRSVARPRTEIHGLLWSKDEALVTCRACEPKEPRRYVASIRRRRPSDQACESTSTSFSFTCELGTTGCEVVHGE